MMPDLRAAIRLTGRRVTLQAIHQTVRDRDVAQEPVVLARVSGTLTPMDPQKLALKPEGQRAWKWWEFNTAARVEVAWFLKPDRDGERVYKVMEERDWGQARFRVYEIAQAPEITREFEGGGA